MYFYFILSGQVEVLKERSEGFEGKLRLHFLNQGECFGQVSLDGGFNEVRASSIVCTTPSEFLRVDIADYRRILVDEIDAVDLQKKVSFLKKVPLFRKLQLPHLVESVASKAQLRYFDKDSVILEEGQQNKYLYFVCKGRCKIEKQIHVTTNHQPKTAQVSGPQRIPTTVLLGHLEVGQVFPEALPSGMTADETNDKSDLLSSINDNDSMGLNKSYSSVKSTNTVTCIAINRIEFVRLVNWPVLKSLIDLTTVFAIPEQFLEEQYVIKKNWIAFRRKVVDELNR